MNILLCVLTILLAPYIVTVTSFLFNNLSISHGCSTCCIKSSTDLLLFNSFLRLFYL